VASRARGRESSFAPWLRITVTRPNTTIQTEFDMNRVSNRHFAFRGGPAPMTSRSNLARMEIKRRIERIWRASPPTSSPTVLDVRGAADCAGTERLEMSSHDLAAKPAGKISMGRSPAMFPDAAGSVTRLHVVSGAGRSSSARAVPARIATLPLRIHAVADRNAKAGRRGHSRQDRVAEPYGRLALSRTGSGPASAREAFHPIPRETADGRIGH